MIPGAEDLRTPLSDSHELELQIRDQTAGFLIPRFVYDVPGAGKRPTLSAENYDKELDHVKYWDPLWSLSQKAQERILSS